MMNFRTLKILRTFPELSSRLGKRSSSCLPVISDIISDRTQDKTLHPCYCDYVWDNHQAHGHLPALVCGLTGKHLTHGEVREEALKVARALEGLDVRKGDVVGVILENCVQYPILVQGCLYLGLCVTPINPAYTAPEITRQLKAASASIIFSQTSISDKMTEVMKLLTHPDRITNIVIGDKKVGSLEQAVGWEDFLKISSSVYPEQADIDIKKDVALLPFSSGTTGLPKAVMLSQYNIVAHSCCISANDPEFFYRAAGSFQDVSVVVLPLYHIYGLSDVVTGGLHHGAKLVLLPSFSPELYVRSIREHRPSVLHLVPPLVSFLASSPLLTTSDLSSLRQIYTGAAPAGPALIEQFYRVAPSYTVFKEGWGQTELAGGVTGMARAYGGVKLGSCNQVVPNTRLQVRHTETGQPLGASQVGEIVVKGPQVMLGYMNNEEANRETFLESRWMRTGDIGYYDQDGFLYIVDRMKELIKVKGLQVAPAELEDVLRGLAGVEDVAVIGVKSEREGEVPRAYIVRSSPALTEDSVQEYMKCQVASHKQLVGGIQFVQSIPKSAAGKILRKDLRAQYRD